MENHSLFIFAHQDDEFAAFHLIKNEILKNKKILVFYFSNGSTGNLNISKVRNAESIKSLSYFSANINDIQFIGETLDIDDGKVIDNLENIYLFMLNYINKVIDSVSSIYYPAWEGGHHDHDACHLIMSAVCSKLTLIDRSYQFPLYHGKSMRFGFFKVLSTITENGNNINIYIPFPDKIRMLLNCFCYRSQIKSFIGLFPALTIKLITSKFLFIQLAPKNFVLKRPHLGSLFYESRKRYCFKDFHDRASKFLSKIK